jgi:hypothetical protein
MARGGLKIFAAYPVLGPRGVQYACYPWQDITPPDWLTIGGWRVRGIGIRQSGEEIGYVDAAVNDQELDDTRLALLLPAPSICDNSLILRPNRSLPDKSGGAPRSPRDGQPDLAQIRHTLLLALLAIGIFAGEWCRAHFVR